MTPDQRAHLRALAERVRAEEPSDELRDAVLIAFGWTQNQHGWWRRHERNWQGRPPNPLTSRDASAEAMPEGWTIRSIEQDRDKYIVRLIPPYAGRGADATAPDLPRAWTAADLLAMAAEGETDHG